MAVLSCFALNNIRKLDVAKSVIGSFRHACGSKVWNVVPVRNCHKKMFVIKNSDFQFKKFKDLLNFYFLLGAIPIVALISYVNLFIGPAKLALIPEGYEPKPWEYHRHPITRFFVKYLVKSPQETHERNLHHIFIDQEIKAIKLLKRDILEMIKNRQDYQAWYFDKAMVKYGRKLREELEDYENKKKVVHDWVQ